MLSSCSKKELHKYLYPQLKQNIQILQVHADDKESQAKRLVTSALIVSLAVLHQLTTHADDDRIRNLLECLFLHGDSGTYKCTEYDALLRHFPKQQHLR